MPDSRDTGDSDTPPSGATGASAFRRPWHRLVARVLECLNGPLLASANCYLRRTPVSDRHRDQSVPSGRTRPHFLHRREAARARGSGAGRLHPRPRSRRPRLHGGTLVARILAPRDGSGRIGLRRRGGARARCRTLTIRGSDPAAALCGRARHCRQAHVGARAAGREDAPLTGRVSPCRAGQVTSCHDASRQMSHPPPRVDQNGRRDHADIRIMRHNIGPRRNNSQRESVPNLSCHRRPD